MSCNCSIVVIERSRATSYKKPQLSDLRDSGTIEQDADVVMLLYRDDYYDDDTLNHEQYSKAELRVTKNRNGQKGVCDLIFQREYTTSGYVDEN